MEGKVIPLEVRRSRRAVVGHFCAFHALSASDAVEYVPQNDTDRREFEAMRAAGILHQGIPRHYWIDLIALKADEDARRLRLVPVVIAACVVVALALTLLYVQ